MTEPLFPQRSKELMAGYVLGNLSSEEAEELRRVLKENPELATEVRRLQEVLEVMPYALPDIAPPPHLYSAILEAASAASLAVPILMFLDLLTHYPRKNLSIHLYN